VLGRRIRLYAGLFLLGPVALTVLIPAAGAQRRDRAQALRTTDAALSRQERRALHDLYSLETQLARARARVSAVERRQARLEATGRTLHAQIALVTQSMVDAQTELQQQLRALYEQPSPDPLAVVLGAQSLDEVLTNLDGLQRVSRQSSAIVHETTATRTRLRSLLGRLDAQRATLARLRADAGAEAGRLAAAAASRRSYVAALERTRTLKRAALAALDEQARRAAHKTVSADPAGGPTATPDAATANGTTAASPGSTATAPAAPPSTRPGQTLTVVATAYDLPGNTASGLPVGPGIAAVDPSVIPLGTRFEVPGYGSAVAADTGPGIRGAEIDLWFPSDRAARNWGRRSVTITFT
jgi:cystine transport system substrate-binding protein